MRTPTPWANNDVKPQNSWSPVTKNPDQWQANGSKQPTRFTAVGKSPAGWSPEHPSQTYFYDDPTIPYDSSYFEYNYMVNNNTDNQRLVTQWSAS